MNIFCRLFVSIVICIFTQDVIAYPWNNNTREHLFGVVNACNVSNCNDPRHVTKNGNSYHVQASILDEGFRWRNSFNFTINRQLIDGENWWFTPIISLDRQITLLDQMPFSIILARISFILT